MRNQKGFSLIEIVIFIVIVGIAVGAMMQLFSTNVARSHEPLLRQKAVSLANFYMDEILRKKWNENSPTGGGCVIPVAGATRCTSGINATTLVAEAGEGRADYDDIDDYNSLPDIVPRDQEGTDLGFAGYSVTVLVETGAAWDPLADSDRDVEAGDILRIQVDVDVAATGETITLVAFRSNF